MSMKGDNYYKIGARSLITGGNIHTSQSGRLAYTPGFLRPGIQSVNTFKGGSDHRRDKPTDFKKLRNRVFLVIALIWFALCLHGVYLEVTIGRG